MKIWIKLLRDYAGHKEHDLVEVDEAIARAYIAAKYAEETQAPAQDLAAVARQELDNALSELRTAATAQTREVTRALGEARDAIRPRPQAPADNGIFPTESEDDKFLAAGGGFRSLGHQAHCIVRGLNPSSADPAAAAVLRTFNERHGRIVESRNAQLRAAGSPDGMFENSDPDGGQLVAPTFSQSIWERVYEQADLLNRLDVYTIAGNTMTFLRNAETSRANGSRKAGTAGYWEGEAQQFTKSKPTFDNAHLRLKKLTVLIYTTNELLADAGPVLDQYLNKNASEEIGFKINDAVMNGTGAGVPFGIYSSPAFIQVAKDTGQQTQTISYDNVLKVYNRTFAPCRPRAIWVYNQEIEPQLAKLALPVGTGGWPMYLPAGQLGKPTPTFYGGLPMLCLEQAPGLGSVGDLSLIDFSQIWAIVKGGIQSSMSIHLKFDYDESVFKWLFRMDCQSAWNSVLTPYKTNTSITYSHAVGIAAR